MTDAPPDEVRRLLDARSEARRQRDWPRADALRDEIATLGWEVQDDARGSVVRPRLPPAAVPTGYAQPADLASLLDQPAVVDASLHLLAEDHPGDLERFLRGLRGFPPVAGTEVVVVANAPSYDVSALIAAALPNEPVVLETTQRLGWADARNLGLRRSLGRVTVLVDTSVEPIGDFVRPLLAAFDDPTVGLAGGWGLLSDDGRQFREAPPGEVDAVEAYCLAVERDALRAIGGFDPRFRYYRNADLDLSFAVRAAGWRAVSTEPLPLVRHEHRGYADLDPPERDRLSRRNFYRFLKHWGDRRDLLLSTRDEPAPR